MAESSGEAQRGQVARGRQRHGSARWPGVWPARPPPSAASRRAAARPPEDPLANFRDTAALFQKLQADPFGTVAEIVDDPAVKGAAAARKTAIAELIRAFTEGASGKAPARSR